MSKPVLTTVVTMSFLFTAGCDQAPKTPVATTVTPQPVPTAKMPMVPFSGGTRLPGFSEWILSKGVKVNAENEILVVDGDNTQYGYQISSPRIEVKPASDFIVQIDYTVESGIVCPGILSANTARWIAPAAVATPDLRFNSGSNKEIFVVMANCSPQPQGIAKSKFRLKSAVIAPATK